jgi:hypothetical protein
MQEVRQSSVKLVQIEPRPSISTGDGGSSETLPLSPLTESEIFRKKLYVGFRKLAGLFYTENAYGTVRRWAFSTFLPAEILGRWRPNRKGECNRCGMCCKIVLHCPFLHEADQQTSCRIYTSEKHVPPPCLSYPFDPWDLADVQRAISPAICPFTFEGEPEHPTIRGAVAAWFRVRLTKRFENLRSLLNR